MAPSGFLSRHSNIYVYVPNLIGYARVCCALLAFALALVNPVACCAAYLLGFVCDDLDGRAARAFNQTSTLGAVLDMVTDRVATSCLLLVLAALYPRALLVAALLLALDISSHWFHMYASLAGGAGSHKDAAASRSWLVRAYYANRLFMGFCCIACEVLYLALYCLAWPQFQGSIASVQLPSGVTAAAQRALEAADGGALGAVATRALEGPPFARPLALSPAALVATAAVPGWAIKQVCNWVQLRAAMQSLVDLDLKKRC